jgi:Caspase domain
MAFLNVSASGPFTMPGGGRGLFYPKSMAQLEYTHADASYYSRFWQEEEGWPWPDELTRFTNHDLIGAQFGDVQRAFDESVDWFAREAEEDAAFDGGGIHFTFSGHGREDGVLVLENDTSFAPRDLVAFALEAHGAANTDQQTKLVVYLDACHSGAFILDLLDIVLSECPTELGVFRATASCFPDELSYEVPELGHGLATYCASIRLDRIDSLMATAGLKRIPLWGVMQGAGGCSLVTMGKQNPIVIGNYGVIEACNREISSYTDRWRPRSRVEWETDLYNARAEFQAAVAALYNKSALPDNERGLREHLESLMVLGHASSQWRDSDGYEETRRP